MKTKTNNRRPSTPRRQTTTTLHIRNMVCNRCIMVVRDGLQRIGLDVRSISLGEAVVGGDVKGEMSGRVKQALERNGFELIEDRRIRTIEQIKHAVLKLVRSDVEREASARKHSEYIAKELGQDYRSLSTLFSSMESITIERYIILQRIERVKELLKYGEQTLSEISFMLGYSSVAHLSNQFKKVTGLTPSGFKAMVENTRRPLDKLTPPPPSR
ncbi:MAG: AraC family transcriptional regulator [Bacteroidota bacterium]